MKILYGATTMGNGHINRTREVLDELEKHVDVDVILSGPNYGLDVGRRVKYKKKGLKAELTKGKVSLEKTIRNAAFIRFVRDVVKLDLSEYDLVVTDLEPISAWAGKIQGKKVLAQSHGYAFLSDNVRKELGVKPQEEIMTRVFAPGDKTYGFYYEKTDPWMYTPIIKKELRNAKTTKGDHITVYLSSYSDDFLMKKFHDFPEIQWHVFSIKAKKDVWNKNVFIRKVDNQTFIESFISCRGIITAAGFTATTEALYLGKKMLIIPIKNHFEQSLNAKKLELMGVKALKKIDWGFGRELNDWFSNYDSIQVDYPDIIPEIIQNIINFAEEPNNKSKFPIIPDYKKLIKQIR